VDKNFEEEFLNLMNQKIMVKHDMQRAIDSLIKVGTTSNRVKNNGLLIEITMKSFGLTHDDIDELTSEELISKIRSNKLKSIL
jgi:hypothetical protein